MRPSIFAKGAIVLASGLAFAAPSISDAADSTIFNMVRSGVLPAGCVPNARGRVTLNALGPVESMHVEVFGLPANTGFDFFLIQKPTAKFGLAWYQGDLTTNSAGNGVIDVVGRFSRETFIVAPGAEPAPKVFPDDATINPATPPVQIYHLGIWFDSPAAAGTAGCPTTTTQFNGTHNAGVQVLNTSNFLDLNGPLRFFNP